MKLVLSYLNMGSEAPTQVLRFFSSISHLGRPAIGLLSQETGKPSLEGLRMGGPPPEEHGEHVALRKVYQAVEWPGPGPGQEVITEKPPRSSRES